MEQATVNQVMDGCSHWWMREALEKLVARHAMAMLQSAL
jgi:diphosphoinositol-polyphosphate diphosphatase